MKLSPRYWIGRARLRLGYCPACNSSPPRDECGICGGNYLYGHYLADKTRATWRQRWDAAA